MAQFNCLNCNNSFLSNYKTRYGNPRKYCSQKCCKDYWKKNNLRKGENHPNWKGGKHFHKGYILIFNPLHPFATKAGYVYEHRLVMEKNLKRILLPQETIHHINGNKSDNRLENLMLFKSAQEHNNHHLGRCYKCGWLCPNCN